MSEIRTVDLANRVLAYREYGAEDGVPLLYFHSTPGSSLQAAFVDDLARERGIRLIGVDRPGEGGSSMSPNQRIVDWPRDIATFTNRLGIERFGILALGGGAPYAWACGNAIGKQISTIGVVSGRVPARSHIKATISATWAFVRLGRFEKRMNNPEMAERVWANFFTDAPELEQRAARDPQFRSTLLDSFRDAFTNGYGGPQKDYALMSGANWGFAMGNVQVEKCYAWHGDADTFAPIPEARRVLERLPHCDIRVKPGEGHFSTWVNHRIEILDTLADAMR